MILCERIEKGMIELSDRSISEHLACFLSNFPRPFEVEQSMGEKFRQGSRGRPYNGLLMNKQVHRPGGGFDKQYLENS